MKVMLRFFDWLANHKGVPVLVAIGLITVNFLLVLINPEGWGARTNVCLHAGLVIGLFGELLADVL